jgi:hypothetical protein
MFDIRLDHKLSQTSHILITKKIFSLFCCCSIKLKIRIWVSKNVGLIIELFWVLVYKYVSNRFEDILNKKNFQHMVSVWIVIQTFIPIIYLQLFSVCDDSFGSNFSFIIKLIFLFLIRYEFFEKLKSQMNKICNTAVKIVYTIRMKCLTTC